MRRTSLFDKIRMAKYIWKKYIGHKPTYFPYGSNHAQESKSKGAYEFPKKKTLFLPQRKSRENKQSPRFLDDDATTCFNIYGS